MTLYAKWNGPMVFALNDDQNSYTLTTYNDALRIGDTVEVPATYNGLPVTAIGDSCFRDCAAKYITLPDGIVTIGNSVFDRCKSLESLVIPNTVTTIGYRLLVDCSSLVSLQLSDKITELPSSFIDNCPKLDFEIPAAVTTLGDNILRACNFALFIPKTVTNVSSNALNGFNGVIYVEYAQNELPAGWKADWANGFYGNIVYGASEKPIIFGGVNYAIEGENAVIIGYVGNSTLIEPDRSITVKGKTYPVTKIKANAFSGGLSFCTILLPDSITEIEDSVFTSVTDINIWIPDSVQSIGANLFYDYFYDIRIFTNAAAKPDGWLFSSPKITEYYAAVKPLVENDYLIAMLGNKVSIIAYLGTETDITLPTSANIGGSVRAITAVDGQAFTNTKVRTIIIPANYTELGGFYTEAGSLRMIYVPASVEDVTSYLTTEEYACKVLIENTQEEIAAKADWASDWDSEIVSDCIIYGASVPELIDGVWYTVSGGEAIAVAPATGQTDIQIRDRVTLGGSDYTVTALVGAFSRVYKEQDIPLTSVKLPDTLTRIGRQAFQYCAQLTEIVIPVSVTEIDGDAFVGCDKLTIYIEHETIPAGFISEGYDNWNDSNRPVYVFSAADPAGAAAPKDFGATSTASPWSGNERARSTKGQKINSPYSFLL